MACRAFADFAGAGAAPAEDASSGLAVACAFVRKLLIALG